MRRTEKQECFEFAVDDGQACGVLPRFTASMAYSTWKTWPSGLGDVSWPCLELELQVMDLYLNTGIG